MFHQLSEIVAHNNHIRNRNRRIASRRSHGNADIGRTDDRSVVDTVADIDGFAFRRGVERADFIKFFDFFVRQQFRIDIVNIQSIGHAFGDPFGISRQRWIFDTAFSEASDCVNCFVADNVSYDDITK